ncbi:hypothetical protein C5S31_08015 [ANME-1 cluster archaeon GoMg2]|nr:hypothetical protein [ANME-1 cluster archaeon GoMg2]
MNNKRIGLIVLTTIMVFFVLAAIPVSALYQWEQVSEEGFGDLTNDYAWAMANYTPPGETTEYLYVGTLNSDYTSIQKNNGCEVWRTDGTMVAGKYVWEQVVGPSCSQHAAGFERGIPGIRNMIEYDGLLWAGCLGINLPPNPPTNCQIWVTNGTHWKLANLPGFGNDDASIRGMAVFKDELYVGTQKSKDGNGANLYKYTGDGGNLNSVNHTAWTKVFSKTADESEAFGTLIVFDGKLYALGWSGGFVTGSGFGHGCEVYRSDDGTTWEEVVGDAATVTPRGFGDDYNGAILSATVFDGQLYVGTQNFRDMAEIWRTSDGINWEPVVQYGFLRTNGYIWRLTVYNNTLIAGTMNPFTGCEIWMSETGDFGTFEQMNIHGMDGAMSLPANLGAFIGSDDGPIVPWADQYGVRTVANYKGNLIVGTASWGNWVDRMLSQQTGGKWDDLSGYVGCEIWSTDGTLWTPPETVVVNKTVWDPLAQDWVNEMDAPLGDTVRFRCEIKNIGSNDLTDIVIGDFLSHSLEYADDATIDPTCNVDVYLGTLLRWDISDTLTPDNSIAIEYDANVIENDHKDVNFVFARGKCGSYWDNDWDYAVINPTLIPTVASSNATGVETDRFGLNEDVYCYAENLPANRTVDIYVVKNNDSWAEGAALNDVSSDKKETVKTQPDRSLKNTLIWASPFTQGSYDIVIDTNRNGEWNEGEPIDSWATTGFEAVPEFTTIAIPVAAILGLLLFFNRRKKRKE